MPYNKGNVSYRFRQTGRPRDTDLVEEDCGNRLARGGDARVVPRGTHTQNYREAHVPECQCTYEIDVHVQDTNNAR